MASSENAEQSAANVTKDAKRRILTDLREISERRWDHIAVMSLSEENVFEWYVNIQPFRGDLKGHIFHLHIKFPQNYPDSPPGPVEVLAPLGGPQVHDFQGRFLLVLDILDAKHGWNAFRRASEIVQQIDEFFNNYTAVGETPEQKEKHLQTVIDFTRKYTCKVTGHAYSNPVPRPSSVKKVASPSDSPKDTYVNNPSSEWQVAKATSGVGFGKVMYEAKLDKVEQVQQVFEAYQPGQQFVPKANQDMCSCRFGWATNDSEDDVAISGIFYGNGRTSHVVVRSKLQISHFEELAKDETYVKGDIISTGIDFENNRAWFARNGKKVGKLEGYVLPEHLKGKKLYPVVGLQCSAVALNFGKPVKHVNDTDDFVTIDVHKMCSKTDYLWMTRPPVAWNKLFTNHPPEHEALQIFKYLKKSELQICACVCKDWKRVIDESCLFNREKLRCCILHTTFEEGVLGLGIIIEKDESGKQVSKVTSNLEHFSHNAWANHNSKEGPSGQTSTHFLPLIINHEHAKRAIPIFKSLLGEYLPGSGGMDYTAENVLRVLTTLMNGAIVTLASDSEECSPELIQNQLELYCHLHHMLLFLNYENTEFQLPMSDLVNRQIDRCLEETHLLEKDNTRDIGTFLLKTAITEKYGWRSVRKPVLLELFDREVPKYLSRYPELEHIDKESEDDDPQDRLQKVLDCTMEDRRRIMVQVFFSFIHNRSKAHPQVHLEEYGKRYGAPDKAEIEAISKKLSEVYAARDWNSYFENLFLKAQDNPFVKNLLIESMARAEKKKYFEPSPIQEPEIMPHADENPNPEEYEPRPVPPRKAVNNFHELVNPLAACLKDHCEPNALQKDALPEISSGSETIVVSPHGTGKHTLAAITAIHTLLSSSARGSHVWVMVPENGQARHFEEILRDVYTEVPENEMGGTRKLPVEVVLCANKQPTPTSHPCVYVGTPHQLFEYIRRSYVSDLNLQAVYILEADYLLVARTQHITDIFSNVPMGIQTVLMSSSYTETFKRQIPLICGEERKLVHKNEYATRFRHWYVACIRPNKKEAMFELLSREMKFKQAIVWTSSTRAEKLISAVLNSETAASLCPSTSHQERRDIVSRFNDEKLRILILSNDVAPYGIKTKNVDCLIHVDMPETKNEEPVEAYERHLSLLQGSDRVIESISFSLRAQKVVKFLKDLQKTYDLKELPADPNALDEDVVEDN